VVAVFVGVLCLASCHLSATTDSGGKPLGTAPASPAPDKHLRPIKKVLPSIEHFVEQERGLKFKHPVKAKVLSDKPFLKQLHKGDSKPKPKQVERLLSTLSSLGLVAPTTPIVKAFKTATDTGTLGFYDFKTKRLYVRGKAATPGVRAVLSHELTHALTDQWFGLNRPKLDRGNQELGEAFTGLIEGDAERTRLAYEAHVLTPTERQEAEQEEQGGGTPPKVPRVVLELIGFPYAVGPQFVDAIVSRGGTAALNHAYKHPPQSSEQLINPASYFAHDNPKHVAIPKADGNRIDHGDLGYVGLLLMLENGLDRTTAQLGIFGWGGDQYSTWRAGKGAHHWCLRDSVVMDDPVDTARFDQTLTQWVATRDGKAHVERTGNTTTFVTCSA
jgi:hypothetical protein